MTKVVTISIPTLNAEKSIGLCLEAIKKQTYQNIEINIVDGDSKDKTLLIAREQGIKNIIIYKGALLGARFKGVQKARGEYILLLDSDQILNNDTIERAAKMMTNGYDMLILEETSFKDKTFIEKLFKLDRKLLHQTRNFSPYSGAVLPRFFRKKLLQTAFNQIPKNMVAKVGGEDHMIIYYECWQFSKKIALLPNAVCHIEPKSLYQVLKNAYHWGYSRQEAYSGKYKNLLCREKTRIKMSSFPKGMFKESLASLTLLALRGIPGEIGFYKARLDKWLKKFQS